MGKFGKNPEGKPVTKKDLEAAGVSLNLNAQSITDELAEIRLGVKNSEQELTQSESGLAVLIRSLIESFNNRTK